MWESSGEYTLENNFWDYSTIVRELEDQKGIWNTLIKSVIN